MPLAATWRNLEITILSEISQRQISYKITFVWNTLIFCNKLNGKESEKVYTHTYIYIYIYIYIYLNHLVVYKKLTQFWKSTTLQSKKLKEM